MSDVEIANKLKQLKKRVSELVKEVNALKKQLEESSITLSEFKSKKEKLETELRSILATIAQYKEKTNISPEIRKESHVAEQAKDLMYYFQTEFDSSISKARIYLSITLEIHFMFTIDYTKYPERPILIMPNIITDRFNSIDEFLQKIPSYLNWNLRNPINIYELVTEIETVLINNYSADLKTIEQASIDYIEETMSIIKRLIRKASTELQVKNINGVIEIYKSIIDLAYEIKDFQIVSEYTSKLDELLKIVRKSKR